MCKSVRTKCKQAQEQEQEQEQGVQKLKEVALRCSHDDSPSVVFTDNRL
jgi:hypothetical protein